MKICLPFIYVRISKRDLRYSSIAENAIDSHIANLTNYHDTNTSTSAHVYDIFQVPETQHSLS